MRHQPRRIERTRHAPGVVDRIAGYWDTATKIAGVAHGIYQVGRAVAPYVAAAVAAA